MSQDKTIVTAEGAKHTRFSSDEEETAPKSPSESKAAESAETILVHSANSWEKADLGDGDRKNKFLRLMGAAKKEHHGRFVIGDKDPDKARGKADGKTLNDGLEKQYTESMEHRLLAGRSGHIGLGFHDDPANEETKEDNGTAAEGKNGEKEDDKDGEKKDQEAENVNEDADYVKKKDKRREKEEETEDNESTCKPSDAKKMKFVKAS